MAPRARYLPFAEHGLIGDLHAVALVGTDGTIERRRSGRRVRSSATSPRPSPTWC
jgi:hypothetical protein